MGAIVFGLAAFHLTTPLRQADGTQDRLLLERLLDEIDSTRLHRLHCEANITVAGDHDGGERHRLGAELAQQLESRHAGHAHIGDQAASLHAGERSEEGRRRLIKAHRNAGGAQ